MEMEPTARKTMERPEKASVVSSNALFSRQRSRPAVWRNLGRKTVVYNEAVLSWKLKLKLKLRLSSSF